MIAFWVALGTRWLAGRLILLGLAVVIVGILMGLLPRPDDAFLDVLFSLALAAWPLGSLLIIRLAGYRMRWR